MQDRISLVIPVKNEENSIGILLESVWDQTRRPDEVVITDGGSTDKTCDIIKSYTDKGYPVRLIKSGGAYPGKARNMAISSAENELIAMTDAGIRLDRNWLSELVKPIMGRNDVDVVYGSYAPVTDSFFKQCLAVAFLSAPRVINGVETRSNSVASALIRKRVWEKVGGFPDFRAAEDRIFMEKIDAGGFCVAFAPEAKVSWNIPSNFQDTFKRFSLYSLHDLKAGRFRDWHYAVLRMYATGLVILLLGTIMSPYWLLLLLVGILARSLGLMANRSCGMAMIRNLRISEVFLVSVIMVWLDIAMFWGLLRYLASRFLARKSNV